MSFREKIEDLIFEKFQKFYIKLKRWQKISVWVISILLTVLILGYFLWSDISKYYNKFFPDKFPQDVVGILVLPFEGDTPDNSLLRDLISTLNNELAPKSLNIKIEVRTYDGTINEAMGLNQAHGQARKLGKKTGSDIVIWGNRIGENKFHPRITIVNDQLRTIITPERTLTAQIIKELRIPPESIEEPINLTNLIIGFGLYEKGDYATALQHFEVVLKSAFVDSTELNDIRFYKATSHLFLAQGNKEMGWHLEQAISDYKEVAQFYTKKDSSIRYASSMNNLGIAYVQLSSGSRVDNLHTAIEAFDSALQIFTEKDLEVSKFGTQINLSVAYAELNIENPTQFSKNSFDYFEAVLQFDIENKFPVLWAIIKRNLGSIYANLSQYENGNNLEKAISLYNEALKFFRENNFPIHWAMIQINLGEVYAKKSHKSLSKNFEKAINAYEAALRIINKEKYPIYWALIQNSLGDIQSYSNNVAINWVRYYGYSEDEAVAVAVDHRGNVYVTGYCSSLGTGLDYFTAKYDSMGTQKWTVSYNSSGNRDDRASDIYLDTLGNAYITGTSTNNNGNYIVSAR